jgi:crossover junction endodeoxyribonuclease RuvC
VILCGIDPGLSGAVCIIDTDTDQIKVHDLPTHQVQTSTKTQRLEFDCHGFAGLLPEAGVQRCIIEAVGPMPKQGVTSMYRFGHVNGCIYGVIVALGLPVSFMQPLVWQRFHKINHGPDDARRKAVQLCASLHAQLVLRKHVNGGAKPCQVGAVIFGHDIA